jgi:hypothetical protein
LHIRHFLQQTISQMLSRMSSLSGHMNIAWVNLEFFTGCKKIKQQRISFVLGYLHIILWKISAISIKHRILATFDIKKFNSDSLYAFKPNNKLYYVVVCCCKLLQFRNFTTWKNQTKVGRLTNVLIDPQVVLMF